MSNFIWKDPLDSEEAKKLEEQAKDISKAALIHDIARKEDQAKVIIEERDLLYKENEIYNESIERLLEENKNLRILIKGFKEQIKELRG